MRYKVSWEGLGGKVIEVDAETRWEAVAEASSTLGLDKVFPGSFLYKTASVKRPGKENLGRRRSVDAEERKSRIEKIEESLGLDRGVLVRKFSMGLGIEEASVVEVLEESKVKESRKRWKFF